MSGVLNLRTSGSPSVEELIPQLAQGGRAIINIESGTPIGVAESVVQGFLQRGVQKTQLGGDYALYKGKLFYRGKTDNTVQVLLTDELANRIKVLQVRGSIILAENEELKFYKYNVYINEWGDIVGVEGSSVRLSHQMSSQISGESAGQEIERELMRSRVTGPGFLGSVPIPIVYVLDFTM
jgi:hypothetical protein